MNLLNRIKKSLRGGVSLNLLVSEAFRRQRAQIEGRRERSELEKIGKSPARLNADFAPLAAKDLLNHFKNRTAPSLFGGNLTEIARLEAEFFDAETEILLAAAKNIVENKKWSLLGFGEMDFGAENVWRRDPLSGIDWGLDYHRDLKLSKPDGADIRVLWELNRFGHALTLARAYTLTGDEALPVFFFSQVKEWKKQNPYGRGANWTCAMEVALRAMNLLAAFEIFRHSTALDERILADFLQLFDQHGRFIVANSEFSFIRTSNHYLTNVAGLLWLGTLLPELESAAQWRENNFRELLREMDKQVLPDGANYESSTGYHRYVTELFLYSFLLCRQNGFEIPGKHSEKLRLMLEYIHAYLRPDGFAPLVGDADGGQVLPLVKRNADDHGYLLALGAIFFDAPQLKSFDRAEISPEAFWLTGTKGVETYRNIAAPEGAPESRAFAQTGAYIMRRDDLYLYFNAQDCGLGGRGSHAHNDKLSVEISVFGSPFIIDAGSYAYGFDLESRHVFRSTAYHSTVQIDDAEQNSTDKNLPFVIGNEARPSVLEWKTGEKKDRVTAEHFGYARFNTGIGAHRRTVEFDKIEKYWIIEDELSGAGAHRIQIRFHLAAQIRAEIKTDEVLLFDDAGNRLRIKAFGLNAAPEAESVWVSGNYGERRKTLSVCWTIRAELPFRTRFEIVPTRQKDELEDR